MAKHQHDYFFNAKQLAEYLDLSEKKVYSMANEQEIPGTKITGKWLFPKALIDKWLVSSCHHGILSDRLLITGSFDPAMHQAISVMGRQVGRSALFGYTPTQCKLGLSHLANGFADLCCIHWGHLSERDTRHPALIRAYPQHKQWIVIHAFSRRFGLILRSDSKQTIERAEDTLYSGYRWALPELGSGDRYQFDALLNQHGFTQEQLNISQVGLEGEQTKFIVRGDADITLGSEGAANELGLLFIPLGEESFDIVMQQGTFFRNQTQALFKRLQQKGTQEQPLSLTGYNLADCGKVIWSA